MIDINPTESIIEEFWDPRLSEIGRYGLKSGRHRKFRVKQAWCWVEAGWQAGSDLFLGELSRDLDLDLTEYGEIVVCGAFPGCVTLELHVTGEDGSRETILREQGNNDISEYHAPLKRHHLIKKLSLHFQSGMPESGKLFLLWIGAKRKNNRGSRPLEYPNCASAEKYFDKYLVSQDTTIGIEPTKSFFITPKDLPRLRRNAGSPPCRHLMDAQRKSARRYMETDPSSMLKGHVWLGGRAPDFSRTRDRAAVDLRKACLTLALVAMVDNDVQAARCACKYALILAGCGQWRESFMANYPFSFWRHAAFTEALCVEAIATVIDWAGRALTWEGERVLCEAIYDKGLWQIEKQFMGRFYRVDNPGLIFFPSLIMGGLLVSEWMPHYVTRVRRHFRLFVKVFCRSMNSDGGSNRPPLYWNKLVAPGVAIYRLTQKYPETVTVRFCRKVFEYVYRNTGRKRPLLERVITPVLKRPGALASRSFLFPGRRKTYRRFKKFHVFLRALLSDTSRPPDLIPLGDRTTTSMLPESILLLSNTVGRSHRPFWMVLADRYLREDPRPVINSPMATAYALMSEQTPPRSPASSAPVKKTELHVFKKSGYFSARRPVSNLSSLFCFFGLPPNSAHRHGDAGSFILQVDARDVFVDRGCTNYGNPLASHLNAAGFHNVLTPGLSTDADQWPGEQNHPPKGIPIRYNHTGNNGFRVKCDLSSVWPSFFNSYIREIHSPDPATIIIKDRVKTAKRLAVTVHFHTPCPAGGRETG